MSQIVSLSQFFDSEEKALINELLQNHADLTLVGGAARDFLLFNKKSTDLDMEVRHLELSLLKDLLIGFVSRNPQYKFTELPFGVFRVSDSNEHTLEFSLPRMEEVIDPFHHHYFKAQLEKDLPYDKAFIRRDFTINAIGIKLKNLDEGIIIDPFLGLEDAKKKILRAVSAELFSLDPVRFLRAYRFREKFHYEFDESIKDLLLKMPLHKLSFHYFKEEWKKADNFLFGLNLIGEMSKKTELPSFFEQVSRLSILLQDISNNPTHEKLLTPLDFKKLGQLFYFTSRLDFKNLDEEKSEVEFARSMFGLSEKEMKALLNVRALWKIKTFSNNDFGTNETYHFYLKMLQKRLIFLANHEEFFKTFFPDNFQYEWAVYKDFNDLEKNLTSSLKAERESVVVSWRSLFTLHRSLPK